jgi:MFS family permease
MDLYRKVNNYLGWLTFAIASVIYILTSDSTASFWDCGEYISTAYKLQVGHPPGAPFFQLIGRFFTLFAFGNTHLVARMINTMSALVSGFTILFLFWTITLLAKKLMISKGDISRGKLYAIMGSGLVGALAYTFSDSFWFSAVEGEVYAMSSCFTAIVFWAILKWEESSEKKHAIRWIILIAYLIGLSIGVHLLNLLAIPAITFIYYFKRNPLPSWKGIIKTLILSFLLLAFVMYGVIPWVVKIAGLAELFFVNTLRLPFNSGTLIYLILIFAGIIWGLWYTRKHQKIIWNTIILCFAFILIGYSSFLLLIIRANTNTPINENNPRDAIGLLSYLNREQYGDWPLLYGPYYNAPVIGQKDGHPVYAKDYGKKKYVITDERKGVIPVYDPQFMTIFPRMWCNTESYYADGYEQWGKIKGVQVSVTGHNSKTRIINKPTFGENLRFFFNYQVNYMYLRYFMWNFAGRQNDNQGYGDYLDGNWCSGIKFIDEKRLGTQDNLPEDLRNKGYNRFYMLPLLLGLIGLSFQWQKSRKDTWVLALLFILTGITIVVYLNQYAPQPRERDYAYAASFYAFAIWIGLGVLSLYELVNKKLATHYTALIVTAICLILVPGIMAKEGWDDHDRSGRHIVLSTARNYLSSCAPNAILFTNADNDTFPLWYVQEVEGFRTDVRVVNLSLLNTDWYIDQMKRKAYDSDPVPFSLTKDIYKEGSFDITYLINEDSTDDYIDLKVLMGLLRENPDKFQFMSEMGRIDYLPAKKFKVPVDSALVVINGTVPPSLANRIVPVEWTLDRYAIYKNELMILDLLGNNDWKRPVYFASTAGDDAYLGLQNYFQLEGLAYRLIPVKMEENGNLTGQLNTGIMYDNLMNKFDFTNLNDPGIYLDETARRMTSSFRNCFVRLAIGLATEGKNDSAVAVCDRCMEAIPDRCVPYNTLMIPIAETYYNTGKTEKGNMICNRLLDYYEQELNYLFSFDAIKIQDMESNIQQPLALTQHISKIASDFKQDNMVKRADDILKTYSVLYFSTFKKQ